VRTSREFLVTEAAPEDADAIRALMAAVIRADVTQDPDLLRDTIANVNANLDLWLRDPGRCLHLKAVASGRIVGAVLVKDFWNLCSLFVASDMQHLGVGRMLVEAAARTCTGKSPKGAVYLNAATNAIPFYRRVGFVPRESTQPLPPGFQAMQRPL
jgi:GNAT superfamily N-acetyltransferase